MPTLPPTSRRCRARAHLARLSIALVAAAAVVACGRAAEVPTPDSTPPAPQAAGSGARAEALAATPAPITPAQLRQLRWIEGTWRGEGDGQPPFYERYRFADDSTLVVESFADSTLAVVNDTTRFELRGGRLANAGEGSRWAAVSLDADAVTFEPLARARNTFTWRRGAAADAWTALLAWPATPAAAARERRYDMTRWPR